MNQLEWDVCVLGAGAAGLLAAGRSAECGGRTLLLEKNRKAGVKILMSGGTRCNLTHDCDAAGIMKAFGRNGRFLRQALAELGPTDTVDFFQRLGVATKVEATGKVFPASDRAVTVRDALVRYATDCGAVLRLGVAVEGIQTREDGVGMLVETNQGAIACRTLVVTTGGRSWPKCGTTGDGYQWLSDLGHTITHTYPALVPLRGGTDWSRALSGLTLDNVLVRVWVGRPGGEGGGVRFGKRADSERSGGFLFTHFGFSGPAVMDVSRAVTSVDRLEYLRFQCDWIPHVSLGQLDESLANERRDNGGQHVVNWVSKWVPRRMAEAFCGEAGCSNKPLAELSGGGRSQLVGLLKQCEFPLTGSRGFDKAEVTAGGVELKEIDPRSMQSKVIPGLFVAGEILDLDGWIGGYNFQSAFSTGYVAGRCAAEYAQRLGTATNSQVE